MKILGKKQELCIKCHACETACSTTWFKEDNAEKSCIKITEASNDEAKITVCNQCGECIDICPIQAITRDKSGVVRISKSICVGCFMCVGFCSELAMQYHDDYIEPFKCITCGQCVKVCPTEALFVIQE